MGGRIDVYPRAGLPSGNFLRHFRPHDLPKPPTLAGIASAISAWQMTCLQVAKAKLDFSLPVDDSFEECAPQPSTRRTAATESDSTPNPSTLNTHNFAMGWLKPTALLTSRVSREITGGGHHYHDTSKDDLVKLDDNLAQHLEAVEIHSDDNNSHWPSHPIEPIDLEDSDLPFIPSAVVRSAKNSLGRTWIVVDNIVYDCTDFAHEHPGGDTVINSFSGQDCSWQFWRFHNSAHMRESGRPLRVGRTSGIKNRFAERPRFVGLRRKDEW